MIALILLFVLLALVAWLLWTPLRIEIDSEAGIVYLAWQGVASVKWEAEQGLDVLQLRVIGFRKDLRMGQERGVKAPPTAAKPAGKKRKKARVRRAFPLKTILRMARNVLCTFKINRLKIYWDSDDFIWSARLYPLVFYLNYRIGGQVAINFRGRRALALSVENRLGRMIWAVLQTFTTKS